MQRTRSSIRILAKTNFVKRAHTPHYQAPSLWCYLRAAPSFCFATLTKPADVPDERTGLQVYNSLTGSVDRLPVYINLSEDSTAAAATPNNSKATPRAAVPGCYTCGPTVYAPSHLGHARTYVWLDIFRRVWEFSVAAQGLAKPFFVLNITDVDDKILAAAVSDDEAPLELARRYEQAFWNDWDALNCLRPDVVTRVTEHVDLYIVPYIERLVELGMAYTVDSVGVYFDVGAYEDKARVFNSRYGKLAPPAQATDLFSNHRDSNSNVEQDDGHISALEGKRDPRDFALWKQRKDGERMYWSSPWGEGRPGWHIECSAMIEAVQQRFRDHVQFAVHAGGVDLKFPHHTNEIAQAEAYHAKTLASGTEWIPHWIHTGHLHIDGLKMSKSLKNFVTIQDMLSEGGGRTSATGSSLSSPADDFRLWCLGLSGSYRGSATYSKERLQQARDRRETLVRFLVDAQVWLRKTGDARAKTWTSVDEDLVTLASNEAARGIRALMADLDGATHVAAMTRLAEQGNRYLAQTPARNGPYEVVQAVVEALRTMLSLVGFSDSTCRAGLASVSGDEFPSDGGLSMPVHVVGGPSALLDELVRFRSVIRELTVEGLRSSTKSRNSPADPILQAIMKECDELRDQILPTMGVELMDGKVDRSDEEGRGSAWRVCVPRSVDEANSEVVATTLPSESSCAVPRLDLRSIPLEEFFQVGQYKGQFSAFDEKGFPTLDMNGSELSNRLRQKLVKKRDKHVKRLEMERQQGK